MEKLLTTTIIASFLVFPMSVSAQSISEQLEAVRQAAMNISTQINSQPNETTTEPNQCTDLRAENERLRDRIHELEEENGDLRGEDGADESELTANEQNTRNIEERLLELAKSAFEVETTVTGEERANYDNHKSLNYNEREAVQNLWERYDHSEEFEGEHEVLPRYLWGRKDLGEKFVKELEEFVEERREIYEIEHQ